MSNLKYAVEELEKIREKEFEDFRYQIRKQVETLAQIDKKVKLLYEERLKVMGVLNELKLEQTPLSLLGESNAI